jgi:hypothetical protein
MWIQPRNCYNKFNFDMTVRRINKKTSNTKFKPHNNPKLILNKDYARFKVFLAVQTDRDGAAVALLAYIRGVGGGGGVLTGRILAGTTVVPSFSLNFLHFF